MENPTTEDTTVPTTDTPVSEVPSAEAGTANAGESNTDAHAAATGVEPSSTSLTSPAVGSTSGDAGNAPASSLDSTGSKPDASADASTGTEAPLPAGTTVDVTQVSGQTVNTNVQNGNQLAGSTGNVLVNETPTADAPVLEGDSATVQNVENDLNPLVPAAGTEGAPASQLAAQAAEPEPEPLPRESHLMLLEAKFGAAVAKLRNAERVAVDEMEAIWVHIQAVL